MGFFPSIWLVDSILVICLCDENDENPTPWLPKLLSSSHTHSPLTIFQDRVMAVGSWHIRAIDVWKEQEGKQEKANGSQFLSPSSPRTDYRHLVWPSPLCPWLVPCSLLTQRHARSSHLQKLILFLPCRWSDRLLWFYLDHIQFFCKTLFSTA